MEPKKLKAWLREIKKKWAQRPSFQVPAEKLKHLAVICDGNRRAAKERGLNPYFGHRAGVEVIEDMARACRDWGIRHLTFWVWSTENWRREKKQIDYIMGLAARFLKDSNLRKELLENRARFIHLGRKDRLGKEIGQALADLEKETAQFDRFFLNLAMDYGGRDELVRAYGAMIREGISADQLAQQPSLLADYLDTQGQPDPDLIIRTGTKEGEIPHTSGFMIWQSEYSCWDYVPDLFPNLTPERVFASIQAFLGYKRRFGK